jgi:hypothetical protein
MMDWAGYERRIEAVTERDARKRMKWRKDKRWGTIKKRGQHIRLQAPRLAEGKAKWQ